MAYLKHQAHAHGSSDNGSTGEAVETDSPRIPGIGLALVVWVGGFAFLTVAIFWDLIAALFFRP
jgi:hypothetical protein